MAISVVHCLSAQIRKTEPVCVDRDLRRQCDAHDEYATCCWNDEITLKHSIETSSVNWSVNNWLKTPLDQLFQTSLWLVSESLDALYGWFTPIFI